MGEVARLFVAVAKHGRMLEQSEARAITNRGFQGCAHGRVGGRRQVLLVEGETLRQFGLAPGAVRENITTEGIFLADLRAGERLQVGREVVLEVTIPCEPCDQLEAVRAGLRDELRGRRGILCRVIEGGSIRPGDAIEVAALAAAAAGITNQRKVGSA